MMVIGPEHALAQLVASIAFADAGPGNSRIRLYADAGAATGASPVGNALADVELAKPCGTITAGVLKLNIAQTGGALVLETGTPYAAQWVNGDSKLVQAGTVTDVENAGDFTVSGGTTAPGATSPTLYAGGLVLLGNVLLT